MRILIISDIHGNMAALEVVLRTADEQGYDRVWCLGDVVGYGPNPNECVAKVRDMEALCIAGNHDWAALGKVPLEDFNLDAQRATLWTREQLTPESVSYLEERPQVQVKEDFTLVHGSPRHPIWEYIHVPSVAAANFAHFDTPYCLVGHSHVQVIFRHLDARQADMSPPSLDAPLALSEERLIINPGSVGQPRDGDPRASFAILDQEAGSIRFYRVEYPIGRTQARMMEADLPSRLAARLAFGW
ncbi:MAG: metallophosphoesterase family protein [Chloroflexota bacterium]|nr:metallophosphoesterase family protein [Chloroflexota bacterium]